MKLKAVEFIRRFCLHVLPCQFVKIRHYGLLSNMQRQLGLKAAKIIFKVKEHPRVKLTAPALILERFEKEIAMCTACKEGLMEQIQALAPLRGSPVKVLLTNS